MKFAPYRIRKRLKEIISPQEVDVTDVSKLKSGLSGKIWQKGGMLKPEVRTKMIELARTFYKFLDLEYTIKDIYFTGSLANYNWTSHSDADIHILFDSPEEDSLLSEYIFAKKEVWSEKHDITIYGFPVELFAKNIEAEHGSKSIFSLLKNKWVKKPSKKNVNIDAEAIQMKTADIMNKVDDIEKISDDSKKYDAADKLKDKVKKMRASALEVGGEYSTENLVFKTLRNNGYLEKLDKIKVTSFDRNISLNEGFKKEPKRKFSCLMLYFNIPNWNKIIGLIKPEDIYSEPGFGIEEEPHVTVLFGFHDNEVALDDIKKLSKKVIKKPTLVKVVGVSMFESDDKPYDVVKLDIESKELVGLNKRMQKFPHTSSFRDYHPHMTIAYVKKGLGQKYIREFKNKFSVTGDKMVYSRPDKTKDSWSLIKKNILKIQNGIPGMTPEKIKILKYFVNFTCAKLQMEGPVTVVLRKGRDEYITTTASYIPSTNENHIRAGGRSISDLCKSLGHEICHNRQLELGLFKIGDSVQNIGGAIEDQANAIAGILVKDFTHNYGYDYIYDI